MPIPPQSTHTHWNCCMPDLIAIRSLLTPIPFNAHSMNPQNQGNPPISLSSRHSISYILHPHSSRTTKPSVLERQPSVSSQRLLILSHPHLIPQAYILKTSCAAATLQALPDRMRSSQALFSQPLHLSELSGLSVFITHVLIFRSLQLDPHGDRQIEFVLDITGPCMSFQSWVVAFIQLFLPLELKLRLNGFVRQSSYHSSNPDR